jgi:hypothetical protein
VAPSLSIMTPLTRFVVGVIAALTCGCVSARDVSGHACIVLDIRNPGLCGAMQLVGGLRVVEVASGNHTTTDDAGNFSVAIPTHATSAVLRIAEDADNRRTSLVGVPAAPAYDVLTPVVTATLWDTYLTALHITEDPSLATVHVSFPYPGAVIGSIDVAGAAQVLYDQGEPFDWAPMPPGDQTIAVMALGVAVDAGTAAVKVVTRTDEVIYSADVPVEAGAITWVAVVP